MADAITPVYQFTAPEVGGSDDTWGIKLNNNWTKLDTLFSESFADGTISTLGVFKKNLTIKKAGAKQYEFRSTSNVLEGLLGTDASNNLFLQRNNASGSLIARLRLEADGAIAANAGFFKGNGSGLTSIPLSSIDFSTPVAATLSQLVIKNASNRNIAFWTDSDVLVGNLYSNAADNSMILRARGATVTNAQLRLYQNGVWSQEVGYWDGIRFGSALASSNSDVTRHIDLFGGSYGIGVTSNRLNIIFAGSGFVDFVSGGSIVGRVDTSNDLNLDSDFTFVTRLKGDTRYRNASNLNAGTVNVARLPVSTSEGDRVQSVLAFSNASEVGTYAMLSRASGGSISPNTTYSGSDLRYSGYDDNGAVPPGSAPTGTWKAMGQVPSGLNRPSTLFLRIA